MKRRQNIAQERGEKDGLNHAMQVMSGQQGAYRENDYPSNPYSSSRVEWGQYNRAFRAGFKSAFTID